MQKNLWYVTLVYSTTSVRRIFERRGLVRKFQNNEDQKKFLHSESVRFPAQN